LKKYIVVLLLLTLLISCKSTLSPESQYQHLIKNSQLKLVKDVSSGIENSFIRHFEEGTLKEDYLSLSDNIVNRKNYLSNYVVYKFTPKNTSDYKFLIESIPFVSKGTRSLFKPEVLLLDADKNEVEMAKFSLTEEKMTFMKPYRFELNWTSSLKAENDYYIWMQSDNSHIGDSFKEYSQVMPIGLPGGELIYLFADHSIYLGAIGKFSMEAKSI